MKIKNTREFIAIWLMNFGTEWVTFDDVHKVDEKLYAGAINSFGNWRRLCVPKSRSLIMVEDTIGRRPGSLYHLRLTPEAIAYLGEPSKSRKCKRSSSTEDPLR